MLKGEPDIGRRSPLQGAPRTVEKTGSRAFESSIAKKLPPRRLLVSPKVLTWCNPVSDAGDRGSAMSQITE